MKPFDLEAALRGDPVVTRDGRPVTGLHKHEGVEEGRECLSGVLNGIVFVWHLNGVLPGCVASSHQLFMAPKKVTLWVNVYRDLHHLSDYSAASTLYKTKNAADDCAKSDRVACVPIEFEV